MLRYDDLVSWCEKYDQAAFDPGYPNLPLQFFRPYVEEVFLKRKPFWWSEDHPMKTAVTGNVGTVEESMKKEEL